MSTPAHTRRFSPGEWYALVGEVVTLVLPPSGRDRAAGLWELLDAGGTAEELLDAVLSGGLRSLEALVLVSQSDGGTRALVRGAATVHLAAPDGEVTVSAAPGTVWGERVVAGATSVRIQLGDSSHAADAALPVGLVRVGAIELGSVDATSRSESEPEAALEPAPESLPAPDESPEPVAEPGQPEPAPEHRAEDSPDEPAEELPAHDFSDLDGQTRAGPAATDFTRPPVPGQELAPPVVSTPVAKLVFSTGEVVDVDRTILTGRAPEARRFASQDQPRLITVPSPNQEISSTHVEFRPGAGADHGMAIVTDLGSTNGTVIVQPGLPPEDLQPGIAVSLIPGAVLDLGDGVTIQVTNP